VVAQPDEIRHANRTAYALEWYDRHRAYNTTSGSTGVAKIFVWGAKIEKFCDVILVK